MLAYYVEWQMREAWASELMFADCDQAAKASRDPVAPATRSEAAMKKACSHTLDDGTPVHSFQLFDARALHHRAQYLSRTQRRRRRTDFPDHHYAQPEATTRT